MINELLKYDIKENEILSKHCTMKVGGKADFYYEPKTNEELVSIIKICKKNKVDYFILGNGSNVIFRDKGFRGIILCTKRINKIRVSNTKVRVDAGVNLYVLHQKLIENALTGMEWSYGIPGTIGGAVCMNAGAYGGEIKDVIEKVKIFDGNKVRNLTLSELKMEYRNSIVKQQGYIVLQVFLNLFKGNAKEIGEKCKSYLQKRKMNQPLEYFNSGSIFKTTNGIIAGKIIDNLGLKGATINQAQISRLHANFIVNLGNATCTDIINLIQLIKMKVKEKTSVTLEEEVIIVGEE